MKTIPVGVIGYGGTWNMGRNHLHAMQALKVFQPVAVCDLDPKRAAEASRDFPGIETYTDVAEFLKKSKAQMVTIITPHSTHAPLALQCLRAGRHVVVEKPMAMTAHECRTLVETAERHGVGTRAST